MVGVLVNSVAVILGSVLGLLANKGIPERLNKAIMSVIGLCVVVIGITNALKSDNTIVIIFSLVIGTLIGTLIKIEDSLDSASQKVSTKLQKFNKNGSNIAEGLLSASLLFFFFLMAITGSIQSGLTGDNSTLFTKSLLDFISAMVLSASLGVGVAFSSVAIFIYQGLIVLLAAFAGNYISESIPVITAVGGIMIMGLGINMIGMHKFKIADMLPSIILAPIFYFLFGLII